MFPTTTRSHAPRLLPAFFCLVTLSSLAQQPAPPRALPVPDDAPVPKAIPVAPPPKAQPVPDGAAAPKALPPKTKGPDDDMYDFATLAYDRGEWGMAAQSYAKYLQQYPGGRQVADALFRIGECYKNQNQLKQAGGYYEEVVNRYPSSEGAPSAAYRLGAMLFNDSKFADSAKYFAFCESKTKSTPVRVASAYHKSRAYGMLGDKTKQAAALTTVIAVKSDAQWENQFRETALLTLGSIYLGQDKRAEALPIFDELVKSSTDRAIIAEASIRAAVLYAELKKPDESIAMFEKALRMPETSEQNRGISLVGIIQALYAKGDYDGVIDYYNKNSEILPQGESRAKMLLLVGHAYRMRKSYARAVEVYLLIEQYHPDSEEAFDAGYWKLYCFYLLNDKDLGEFSTAFITRHSQKHADHEYLALARLIRADFYFNKGDYKQAALSYNDVNLEKLPEKLRPGTLFNMGWAQGEAGRHQEAVGTFTRFINENPTHELAPKAYARRGLANRDARDLPKAKADFEHVTKEFPKSDACELSWLQLGFIAMEQKDPKETITAFETLLKKFPNTTAAAQAYYGIGRGNFDQKIYDKAVPALRRSIELDSKGYLEKSSQLIILCDYARQNADNLAKTIDSYLLSKPDGQVPPNILKWLGLKLYSSDDFKRAARFLELAVTPQTPENTEPIIWNYLGMAQFHNQKYDASIQATDNFLKSNPDSAARARALLTKGRAQLGKGLFDEADQAAQDALQVVKDGKLQAELLTLEGDIYAAQGDKLAAEGQKDAAVGKWKSAAAKYAVPSQVFEDPDVTPEALYKAAQVLEKAGDAAKAKQMMDQLKQRYPKYQPKR
ncbi:tetratricopeptide repeat protein [Prosthecobacter sp.]|uniref:tetratricopeptide repeat protein n=1 Tax=Prosthecobacter sp. TaxID=1965333 RepID=UPI0037837857